MEHIKRYAHHANNYGDLFTRIVAGLIFTFAGYSKLFVNGIEGTGGFFASLGIPLPTFFAAVVGIIELVGGIMLIIGIFTWGVGALLAIIMATAIMTAHNPMENDWNSYKFPLLLFVLMIKYAGSAGKHSLHTYLKKKKS